MRNIRVSGVQLAALVGGIVCGATAQGADEMQMLVDNIKVSNNAGLVFLVR